MVSTIVALVMHKLGMNSTAALGVGAFFGVVINLILRSRLEGVKEDDAAIA
jgi:hypothetical protein